MRLATPLLAVLLAAVLPGSASRAADAPSAERPLTVRLESPRGGTTSARLVTIRGELSRPLGRVLLVVNGLPMSTGVSGTRFEQAQVLAPGPNTIEVLARADGVTARDGVAIYAQVPTTDLRVTLTWDTPASDVDLWVVGPDGEKIYFSHRQGRAGGTLDTDVTTGFGPETYTQARLERGTYRIQAHAYALPAPARVEVTTVRAEGTPEETRAVFVGFLRRTGEVLEVGQFVEP